MGQDKNMSERGRAALKRYKRTTEGRLELLLNKDKGEAVEAPQHQGRRWRRQSREYASEREAGEGRKVVLENEEEETETKAAREDEWGKDSEIWKRGQGETGRDSEIGRMRRRQRETERGRRGSEREKERKGECETKVVKKVETNIVK